MQELPEGTDPLEYGRVSAGITLNGDLIIWCERHDAPINMFTNGQIDKQLKETADEPCDGCGEPHSKHYKTEVTH
jgi:hypothetical protein